MVQTMQSLAENPAMQLNDVKTVKYEVRASAAGVSLSDG
jgi:hypothetical protein